MTYIDTLFLVLLIPLVAAVRYVIVPVRLREWLIIAASVMFLATWGHVSLLVFLSVIAINFAATIGIDRAGDRASRYLMAGMIAADLLALGYFKYFNFFIDSWNGVAGTTLPHHDLGLPLAISFYTFHLVSYLVDLQGRRVRRAGVREYLFYLSFFPHLVAGPIVRAWQFFPQIGKRRDVLGDLPVGLYQFVSGIFLKSIIADNIAQLIDPIWDGTGAFVPTGADHWAVAWLYYCQIYADFAGYSLMALGMSRFLGYRLPPNFRQPMLASSLQEFWRRWHMTLSRWLRDYLYRPLGGSRAGRWRTSINLMATMLLGGLWHGAGWTLVIWGALHGAGLVIERALGLNQSGWNGSRGAARAGWFVITQIWVTLAWIFFRSANLHSALTFLGALGDRSAASMVIHPPIRLAAGFGLGALLHQAFELGIVRMPRRWIPGALGLTTALAGVADVVILAPSKVFIYFKF
ncbi:MAG: MBOAT family O-acyltransferase [Bryobacteraceae bacterium]|jgi:alginate O-acetyltransferase complex protein AlgI